MIRWIFNLIFFFTSRICVFINVQILIFSLLKHNILNMVPINIWNERHFFPCIFRPAFYCIFLIIKHHILTGRNQTCICESLTVINNYSKYAVIKCYTVIIKCPFSASMLYDFPPPSIIFHLGPEEIIKISYDLLHHLSGTLL